jgi:hypothetical protein
MKRAGGLWVVSAALIVLACPAEATPSARVAAPASGGAIERGHQLVDAMSMRSERVHRLLRDARRRRHAAVARCLDGKLSEAHAMERQALRELARLSSATQASRSPAPHAARLAAFAERSEAVVAEANNCGSKARRRARLPTGYSVRMIAPRLPPLETISRR